MNTCPAALANISFNMSFTLPPMVEMTEVETNGSIFTGAAATLSLFVVPVEATHITGFARSILWKHLSLT
jgi:hypothetical protein